MTRSHSTTVSETGCSTIDGVAVTNGISTRYAYDANGNTLSGNGKTYAWTAFNKPWKIDPNGAESQFWYAPDRGRYKQVTTEKNGVNHSPLRLGRRPQRQESVLSSIRGKSMTIIKLCLASTACPCATSVGVWGLDIAGKHIGISAAGVMGAIQTRFLTEADG